MGEWRKTMYRWICREIKRWRNIDGWRKKRKKKEICTLKYVQGARNEKR